MAEGVARDELLGESRPSAYLANAAVCNICITSELPRDSGAILKMRC